jgi:hypothetical protein
LLQGCATGHGGGIPAEIGVGDICCDCKVCAISVFVEGVHAETLPGLQLLYCSERFSKTYKYVATDDGFVPLLRPAPMRMAR